MSITRVATSLMISSTTRARWGMMTVLTEAQVGLGAGRNLAYVQVQIGKKRRCERPQRKHGMGELRHGTKNISIWEYV